MKVPLGQYLPDLPALANPGAIVAKNVVPRTAKSYGPLSDLLVFTSGLTARCQGAATGKDTAGNVLNFAGDATKLYTLSSAAWNDASKVGGYSTGIDSWWRFAKFGDRMIATNYDDSIQSFIMTTSSDFADLAAAAPRARYIAIIKDFVMVGNTYDSTWGAKPNRVWWPAIDDPTDWPVPGTSDAASKQSDYQDLPLGGWVQGIISAVGGSHGAVFMEDAIYRVVYEGPPTIFAFQEVELERGTNAPGSLINVGAVAFYLSRDGFYAFDGSRSEPIGSSKVDRSFYADLDESYTYRIVSAADPVNKLVMWAYPGSGHSGGNPNKVLIFNWQVGSWSYAEIETQFIFSIFSPGYTLDGLDATGYNMDTLPFSLDSRFWTSGNLRLGGFNNAGAMGYLNGANLEGTVETGEFDSGTGQRLFVRGVRPLVDGGTVNTAIGYRDTPTAAVNYNAGTAPGVDGMCPQRVDARYLRARLTIPAGSTWSHAQGIEADAVPTGAR